MHFPFKTTVKVGRNAIARGVAARKTPNETTWSWKMMISANL